MRVSAIPDLPPLSARSPEDVPTRRNILRPATITVDDLEDAILCDIAKPKAQREIDMILVEYLLDLDPVA
jgi:hypothetical protein